MIYKYFKKKINFHYINIQTKKLRMISAYPKIKVPYEFPELQSLEIDCNNIFGLKMNTLELEDNLITGSPFYCINCNAVLNVLSKNNIIRKGNKSIWQCEFCQNENQLNIEEEEFPKNTIITYVFENIAETMSPLFLQEKDALELNQNEGSIIFCIDISGSMTAETEILCVQDLKYMKNKNFATRLECVKIAVDSQIHELIKTNPNTTVGIIFFSDFIFAHGDCFNKRKSYGGKFLKNYQEILRESENISSLYMKVPIKYSSSNILKSLQEIKTLGQTALGPAILFSI